MRLSTLSILAIVAYGTATPITPHELSSRQTLELSEAGNVPRGVANSFHNSPEEREVSDISMQDESLAARAETQDDSKSNIQHLSTRQIGHSFTLPRPGNHISFELRTLIVTIAVDSFKVIGMTLSNTGKEAIEWYLRDYHGSGSLAGTIKPGSELIDIPGQAPGMRMTFNID